MICAQLAFSLRDKSLKMQFVFSQSIFTIAFISHVTFAVVYHVKPDYDGDHDSIGNCPYQNCHNLNYYVNKSLNYFSELHFLSGEFILSSDFVIRDTLNISLVGSEDVNSVPNTIIQCNSSVSVIMINITGLTVKNIVIKNCGPAKVEKERHFMMRLYSNTLRNHAIVVDSCISVWLEGLIVITNNNPGLLVMNMMRKCFMTNITVNSIILLHNDSKFYDHRKFLEIKNYSCVGDVVVQHRIVLLSNLYLKIEVTISNTIFRFHRALKFICIISSQGLEYKIYIKHINFMHNQVYSIISVIKQPKVYSKSTVTIEFSNCIFFNNTLFDVSYIINKLSAVRWINCLFHKNSNLRLIAAEAQTITMKNTTFSCSIWNNALINASFTYLLFHGPIKFINITGNSYLLQFKVATIKFYNYIKILGINVRGFLYTYTRSAIIFEENANLEVKYNIFSGYFAIYQSVAIQPYPSCFFQYYNSKNYDELWYQGKKLNYSISFIDNYMKPLPYSYIADCEWNLVGCSAFKTVIPLEVNKRIIIHKSKLHFVTVDNREICFCETIKSFNCTVNKLGPIYPGETLVANLAFFNYWNYHEFHTELKVVGYQRTTCEYDELTLLKHISISVPYHYCTALNITILSSLEKWCALVLYNEVIKPAVFYVMLHPGCPMGFSKYGNKCDCDKTLEIKLTLTCNINHQTISRPANSWISATTNNYSHNYMICKECPFDYCLPWSSYLQLSHPDLQCQFNRSGVLCGQCQQGLSTVFGSSQCEHCSNVYLLFILLFAVLGVLLVFALFSINITVTDGTINAFIFYANTVSINGTIYFPIHQFSYVFISITNLDWGIKTCFYNGMGDYAKMWLQLTFPLYLILIAISLIITSRYSPRVQRLTAHRALPVFVTLFLLSYTKILRTVSNVLFLYSSVVYLPSDHTKLVWSVDANVPLFEVKFMILFITCLVLFAIMIPFNIVLIFTRFFLRFRLVNKFKPLIDAYQGPYKDNCYYWVGLQLVMRAVFLGLSSLSQNVNLKIVIILVSILTGIHGLLCPFKNKAKNYQEFIWLMNLQVLHVLSFNITNMTYVNILITIAMVHFTTIAFYHIITYTRIGRETSNYIIHAFLNVYMIMSKIKLLRSKDISIASDREMNEIPDVTYNYHEYREPLVELDN